MEKPPESPEKKPPRDYNKPDIDKLQQATARRHFLKTGRIEEFDKKMQSVKEGGQAEQQEELTTQERHRRIVEGTVDKDVLNEAAKRKMLAGGNRSLREYIDEVLQERVTPDEKVA